MRYAYSHHDAGITFREISLVRVDKRDVDKNYKPVHIQFPLGPKVAESPSGEYPGWVDFEPLDYVGLQENEIEFDHILTDEEITKIFPDYAPVVEAEVEQAKPRRRR